MRLTSLTLQNYGNFQSQTLDFDPRPGVVNLVLAPNGAGKSVLRGAFGDLLFGIGGQTPMGFRYGYAGMRIMAEAIAADGQVFTFGRRKGQGNTLVDGTGSAMDPARVAGLLRGTDRVQLERLFALDTDRLRQGEAELLASNGALADALEAGAGGVRHARLVRERLGQDRDALAPIRKAAQRPFHAAVDAYTAARRRLSASVLKPDQWDRQRQELEACRAEQAAQNDIVVAASADLKRLERIRRVIPSLRARGAAAAWLAEHPDAPDLDPTLKDRLDAERAAIVLAEERLGSARAQAGSLTEDLAGIAVDEAILAEVTAIEQLVDSAGAARKAMADLPSREAELQARLEGIRGLLQALGSDLTPERAAEAIPPHTAVRRARRLIETYAARVEAVRDAPAQIDRLQRAVDELAEGLARLPAVADHADLADLVRTIRNEGDPARRRRDAEAAAAQARLTCDAALARVPGWTGRAEDLAGLAPMPVETFIVKAEERDAAHTTADAHARHVEEARQALEAARERLSELTRGEPLPDADALAEARMHRDAGWDLIYRRAFTTTPPDTEEEAAFAGSLPLPLAFERAIAEADGVADRQVAEAEAIERAASARRDVTAAEARLTAAEERLRLANETLLAIDRVWGQLCAPLPLGDLPRLAEVQAFLAARDRVIETLQGQKSADHALAVLRETHAAWSARLSVMLGLPSATGLDDALSAAERRLDAAGKAATDRAALRARLDAATRDLAERRARLAEAEHALAVWRTDWAEAARALSRPADEDPAVTGDLLDLLTDLEQAQKAATTLQTRITDMRADHDRFRSQVALLARTAAPDLEAVDPLAAVAGMRQRLQVASEQAHRRALLTGQHEQAVAALTAAEEELRIRTATLQAVLLLTGAETPEAAAERLGLAAERSRHAAALADADARLTADGDGLTLDALRSEVASVPAEDLPSRMEAAETRRSAALGLLQEAASRVSALEQQMRQQADDVGARDAAADQQAAVATIGRVLEEALVLHVAAEMLREAMAAVEQSGDSAAIRRISRYFAALTDGAYTRVVAEEAGEAEPALLLVQRDFPEEQQRVADLSEGTRDQLYLALRLAAIEAQANATPLPFIGDDILQTFDDARSAAALKALSDVSAFTQVILLTHHRHIADLAAQLPKGQVAVTCLGGA
ncbi:MAG: AAA family ATPase [Acetobacteraceae bacterium]